VAPELLHGSSVKSGHKEKKVPDSRREKDLWGEPMDTDDTNQLPYATAKSLRILGKIRVQPEDFQVREIAAYEPSGEGEHLFVHFEKTGLNTPEAARRIAQALDVDPEQTGWAGLKDRHAVTSQWASFFGASAERAIALDLPGIRVLGAAYHPHKMRTGHLGGNQFLIRVQCDPAQFDLARDIVQPLCEHGAPNYYGEQRFGRERDNALKARRWLIDGGRAPRDRFERKFLASALQSEWFNTWLAARVRHQMLGRALHGDLMRKEDTGGMFVALDADEAGGRVARWEISPTGPMFGAEMRWPEGEELAVEQALWAQTGVSDDALSRLRKLLPGTRRVARIRPDGLRIERYAGGIELEFSLPKGAYATVILRELLKDDAPEAPQTA
jgi:tRNA pseudouridine13 synthase